MEKLSATFIDNAEIVKAPPWTRNLVIYQINPYAFTSPNGTGDGSGSGTFVSLKEKMDYLENLGITGIWLSGYCRCAVHFYNIKTVYACIRPDEFDPALGTAQDFKAMIDEAHRRGIKIFLDVIMHGVMNDSPLVAEHPDWFKGGTWRMADYDYDNVEFREWWIKVWTNYVIEYGIDGYRLDDPRQPQMPVWHSIAARCADAGYPIVIFPEHTTTYHFGQRDCIGFRADMAGEFCESPQYVCSQISCADEGWECGAGNYYRVQKHRGNLAYMLFGYNIPLFMSGEEFAAEQVSLPNLERNLYGGGGPGGWMYGSWIQWDQLNQQRHLDMLNDVKKMLKIKRENRDILHSDRSATHILRVPHSPLIRPIPYVRFLPGEKAIVIVTGHEEPTKKPEDRFGDVVSFPLTLNIPLDEMGLSGKDSYQVTNLWSNAVSTLTEAELSHFQISNPRARTANEGVRVYKIEPTEH